MSDLPTDEKDGKSRELSSHLDMLGTYFLRWWNQAREWAVEMRPHVSGQGLTVRAGNTRDQPFLFSLFRLVPLDLYDRRRVIGKYRWEAPNSDWSGVPFAVIEGGGDDFTAGEECGYISFCVRVDGEMVERVRLDSDGSVLLCNGDQTKDLMALMEDHDE